MAVPHAKAGEPVSVQAAPGSPQANQTTTLIKTSSIEVIRLVLPAGKELAAHRVDGDITLQCLSGEVALSAGEYSCTLAAGMMTFVAGGQDHALSAMQDSSLLLTILLPGKAG
jgi:quercetin dioxygenase-like cupin family protein